MKVSFEGIGEVVLTFPAEAEVSLGDFVELSETGMAKPAAAGSDPVGICVSRRGEFAGVQVKGGLTAKCDDSLSPGFHAVKVLEGNQLAKSESGATRLILAVDQVKKQVEVLF